MTRFQNTVVRPFTALAGAGILTLGSVTAPPVTSAALPQTEVHAVQLAAVTAPAAPASAIRPAAASQTADDTTSTTPPDFLAFAAEILAYLDSLGLGAGPGLAAIGLSGFVVAFAATAYVWNTFADTVNPGLRFLRVPRVPKFPVCFAGQSCSSSAAAQARVAAPASSPVKPAGRGVATSQRVAATNDGNKSTPAKVRGAKKSTSSATPETGMGNSKRARNTAAH
ncbi:hypothetical protein [Mycolicibacterium sphagni]|uniref:Uncharacterized protein n=1 Tax=Mycolicibacterium sphagni TaxID=1786 RepID=A0ABX2K2J0_9MYCO|nr:hypothetical protein [Mycolicibacterium sphagni]NTY63187.1 hypothetical protein [Mycolicibacterium sphagni]